MSKPVIWLIVSGGAVAESLEGFARTRHVSLVSCYNYSSLQIMCQTAESPDVVVLGVGQKIEVRSFYHLNPDWFGIEAHSGYVSAEEIIGAIKEKGIEASFILLHVWIEAGKSPSGTLWDEELDSDTILGRLEKWGEDQQAAA